MTPELSEALRGKYIAIDGPDCCGKSSVTTRLAEDLTGLGHAVVKIREPGSTPYGEEIRDLLLRRHEDGADLCPQAEALLFMAARAQLARERITPLRQTDSPTTILSDRSFVSTFAYQGGAGGMDPVSLLALLHVAMPAQLRPDVVVVLDVPVELLRQRIAFRHADRIERKPDDYHEKVRTGFRHASDLIAGIRVVNGYDYDRDRSHDQEEVYCRVLSVLANYYHLENYP